jgi:hypothetical protein
MKKILSFACVSLALGLMGCDHYSEKMASFEAQNTQTAYYQQSPYDIEPAAGGHAFMSNVTFKSHLKNEYMTLATYENNVRKDYKAAKYYTDQIEKIEEGHMVAPATFRDFSVPSELQGELKEARRDLIDAIQLFGIPENRYALALAQSRFDCWMDQAEDNPETALSSACRVEFDQALDTVMTDSAYYTDDSFFDII